MHSASLESNPKTLCQMANSQINVQQLSHQPSHSQISKSPLSRAINSPQSYFSSVSYQRATHISPNLGIQSKLVEQQQSLKPAYNIDPKRYLLEQKQFEINENITYTQVNKQNRVIKNPIKQIALLKSKIKEQQFLIELQTAVHKELMNILSKKDKSLTTLKQQKLDPDTIYQVQQQTESFLDKAESYAKEINKLSSIVQKHAS